MNGFSKWLLRQCCDGFFNILKGNSSHSGSNEKDVDENSKVVTPLMGTYGSGAGGGTRAGLFRTPISGGVQSATSAHGLPRPALAVRNLMEQVNTLVLGSKYYHKL